MIALCVIARFFLKWNSGQFSHLHRNGIVGIDAGAYRGLVSVVLQAGVLKGGLLS